MLIDGLIFQKSNPKWSTKFFSVLRFFYFIRININYVSININFLQF